jgi:hypothetical protein
LTADPLKASKRIALLDAGRLFPQISTAGRLALLHGDRAYADKAFKLCGDLAATVREIGESPEERYQFETLGMRFLLDLREELKTANIAVRRQSAINPVVFDPEFDGNGTPNDERMIANCAISVMDSIC